jgi:gamma-glutamyltranspeptidase/glutathione hydrolase
MRHPKRPAALLLVALLTLLPAAVEAAHPPAVKGVGGAVASAAPEATEAGLEVLRAGGNAADAAVAVALALAVVAPWAGNLGGGGFAVVRIGDDVTALDFREMAPAAASRDMFLDRKGRPDPERSLIGPLAAGVPGSPAGLHELHRAYGHLEWPRVVGPAIRLAEDGFVVSERLAAKLADSAGLLGRFPESAAVWLPDGSPPVAGDRMRLPQLAATLKAYAAEGPDAITSGAAAMAVEVVSRLHGGVLTARDLAAYRPQWREPVRFDAFSWHVASMPLPSSGGLILAESCGILERLGWSRTPRFGAERAHLMVETWRRVYADRFNLGDPRTTRADASVLLAPSWLEKRARSISPTRATASDDVRPWPGRPTPESRETTHLSVADGEGGVVSLTTTLNGNFGCGLMVPGLGFLLNNEMDDFTTAPGEPNMFGLMQGEANAVAPGLRMLSSMSPTVAWRGDETLVLGSPGGSTIPTATLQVLLNVVVDGDELQAAVDRPRIHHQWLPDEVVAESDALSPETVSVLRRRGHRLTVTDSLGEVHAVRVRTGAVEAAADPRGRGATAGVVAAGR